MHGAAWLLIEMSSNAGFASFLVSVYDAAPRPICFVAVLFTFVQFSHLSPMPR